MMRFILYSIFTSLARMFIDRQVSRNASRIFSMIDRDLPEVFNSGKPRLVDQTIARAIAAATVSSPIAIHPYQVQQVRDLFDPEAFTARKLR